MTKARPPLSLTGIPGSGYRVIAVFLFFLAMPAAEAQVYKWTSPDGAIHYGDRPPTDTRPEKLDIPVTSFGGPASVDYASILRRPIQTVTPPADECAAACCGACRNATVVIQSGANGMAGGDGWMGEVLIGYGMGRGGAAFRDGGRRAAGARGAQATSRAHGLQWPVAARSH